LAEEPLFVGGAAEVLLLLPLLQAIASEPLTVASPSRDKIFRRFTRFSSLKSLRIFLNYVVTSKTTLFPIWRAIGNRKAAIG
jgi:hypothetical protein